MDLSWLAGLASAGGAALVAAAATDAWQYARAGTLRLFSHSDVRQDLLEARLAATATQLEGAAAAEREADLQILSNQWATRLSDLLHEHPEIAAELRDLIDGIHSRLSSASTAWTIGGITANAGRDAYVAGRDQVIVHRGDGDAGAQ